MITLTVKKGHNVLRQVYANENNCDANNVNWQDAQKYLVENGVIECTEETDKEMLIYFKDAFFEKFAKVVKPKTAGANISPFSKKNLPKKEKEKYDIPLEDLALYKEIMDKIPKEDKLKVGKITISFISDFKAKNTKDIDTSLTGKNYIHYIGEWDNYLKCLRKEVLCE